MKRGQVWVETVIYTLIGLSLIGIVLAVVTPKINEYKDQTIIDQTIQSLNVIDSKIQEVTQAPGNKRIVELSLERGDLYFNSEEDTLYYVLEDSRIIYSEPGTWVSIGRLNVLTEEGSNSNKITLSLEYQQDLTFEDSNTGEEKFSPASVPYRFAIENKGFSGVGRTNIDISETIQG